MDYQALYETVTLQMETDAAKVPRKRKAGRDGLHQRSGRGAGVERGSLLPHRPNDFLREEPRYAPGDRIDSMEAFARIVLHFLADGAGGEIDITSSAVCDYLEQHFETAYALGGTCAQGAAALGAVGFPVTAYITDRSKPVCELHGSARHAALRERTRRAALMESVSGELPVKHIILQYPKDYEVTVRGKYLQSPGLQPADPGL